MTRFAPLLLPQQPPSEVRFQVLSKFKTLDLHQEGLQANPEISTDVCNVDFYEGGGFGLRRAVTPFHDNNLSQPVVELGLYERKNGESRLMVSLATGQLYFVLDGPNVPAQPLLTSTGPVRRTFQADGLCYIIDGVNPAQRWDGTTLTTLGTAWNPTLSAPVGGNMPIGMYGCVHSGHVWLAATVESGVLHPDRLRFSFPMLNATGREDWRESDYFEIDPGDDGGYITNLIPVGDRLYVTKQKATYAVMGWDTTNFERFPVSRTVGAVNHGAACAYGNTLFVWSRDGLWGISQDEAGRLSAPLDPLIEDKLITGGPVYVSAADNRVWVSLPLVDGRTVYVLDMHAQSWTRYGLELGPMLAYVPIGEPPKHVAADWGHPETNRVLCLDEEGDTDNFGAGAVNIPSHMATAWLTDNSPWNAKHYRSVEAVVEMAGGGELKVDVHRDWRSDEPPSSFSLVSSAPAGDPFELNPPGDSMMVPTAYEQLTPGVSTPVPCPPKGVGDIMSPVSRPIRMEKVRLALSCRARAIRLVLHGPTPSRRWKVHALGLRYKPSRKVF